MKKIILNTIVSAIALAIPAAAIAQSAGASTSGYSAGSGNPTATDIRPSGQGTAAVTTGTDTSTAISEKQGTADPSRHMVIPENSAPETSSSNTSIAPNSASH